MKAQIVIGLGFGDEGKGLVTDYLCSRDPRNTLVVRFCGGQQAGHTVMHERHKHVHSNFGSGSLRGVASYFSEHCSIYLNTLAREREILVTKTGEQPRLFVHPLAKVTTPYDVIFNRRKERKRPDGSCGLGIGTTMHRHLTTGHKLYAMDLRFPQVAAAKLDAIKDYYLSQVHNRGDFLQEVSREYPPFVHWMEKSLFDIAEPSAIIRNYENIVFEGSQGIMLDMDHGIFPNVTYANTTAKNAIEICLGIVGVRPEIFYVTRCYQTRHGKGWMSNTPQVDLINTEEEINVHNTWQGYFIARNLDYSLLNYALSVDSMYHTPFVGIKRHLVVTCMDQRPNFHFEEKDISTRFERILYSHSPYTAGLEKDYPFVKEKAHN